MPVSRAVIAPPMALEVVADDRAFRALEEEWADLLERVRRPHYFQSFTWTWRIWEHIARGRGQQPFIVVGRQGARVVLIWPLVRFKKAGARAAEWIGGEHSYYSDVLVEDAPEATEWLETAWRWVTQRLDFMWLSHMREDAALAPLLRRVEGGLRSVEAAPRIEWSDWPDWDAYYRSRSRNVRKDLRRRRRRLEEQGDVEFRFVTSSDEFRATLTWMLRKKTDWMRRRGLRLQDGGVDSADTQAFYRASVADGRQAGPLRLAVLTLDGQLLAAELGILFRGTLTALMAVYDPHWKRYAPGKLLMADLAKWMLERRCDAYDFMPVGESYKYRWTSREAEITTYLVPCSAWGRVVVAWRRSRLGALVRRMLRLRPTDIPRILRNRLRGRSPQRTPG